MAPTVTDDVIVLAVEITAPAERVFRALTDPAELSQWWHHEGPEPTQWEIDPKLGGHWRAIGRDDHCGTWELSGEIVAFDPPTVFAYTWHERTELSASPGPTLVRYDLQPTDSGTRVTVTHSGFAGFAGSHERYRGGWPGVVGALRMWLETRGR